VRCFVALDLPQPVCNHLAGFAAEVGNKGKVKWVPPEQMHMTLVFAGELADADARQLGAALARFAMPPLWLHLQGLAHFPPRGEPRVLIAEVGGQLEPLRAAQEALAALGEACGVPRDRRPFVPHITLGRVKSLFGALALVQQWQRLGASLRNKPFAPTALTLYRSELQPGGPVHTTLQRVALQPPVDPPTPAPD
jgi:2'-5' RNA ligase